MADDGVNIDFGEMYAFDMVDGDKTVGQMNVSVHRQKTSSRGESQIYPDSWFIGDSEQLKPVLEIDGFGTVGNQGGGYGRAGLQRAYEMSLDKGCDGRVEVHATWGAGKFYEHCGFVGKNGEKDGQPGIKYFEPTEKNVADLYKGGKRGNLRLQTAKPMDFGDIDIDALLAEAETEQHFDSAKQQGKSGANASFTDIVNFKYNEPEVDKDIKQMLETGEFHPAYADVVRDFLAPEIANCKKTIDDDTHHLQVHIHGPMCEDALTRTPQELNPELDWLGFDEEKRQFWYDYFVHPKFGRQKTPPLSILQNGDKKLIMYPFGLSQDAFYSVYTEIHELMHGMQAKYDNQSKEDEYLKEHYELLYQGKSRDEAVTIQSIKHFNLKKDRHYSRCLGEMQANSAATTYMMLKAVETGDKDLITKVEKRLLNESASMSGALMNERLGLAYFEYPATKKIIEEVKQGKCAHLLNDDGLLNWSELYKYTKDKVAEMGYSKEDMNESLNTAKMLKEIRAKHPDSKEEFLSAVEKEALNMPHPHNKIFREFVEAQRDYTPDSSQNLHRFYDYLGVKDNRETLLEKADSKNVPHIEEYRQIYAKSKLLQQKMQAQIINKVR